MSGHLEKVVGGAGLFVRADLDLIPQSLWVMPGLRNKIEAEDYHGITNSLRNVSGDGIMVSVMTHQRSMVDVPPVANV